MFQGARSCSMDWKKACGGSGGASGGLEAAGRSCKSEARSTSLAGFASEAFGFHCTLAGVARALLEYASKNSAEPRRKATASCSTTAAKRPDLRLLPLKLSVVSAGQGCMLAGTTAAKVWGIAHGLRGKNFKPYVLGLIIAACWKRRDSHTIEVRQGEPFE